MDSPETRNAHDDTTQPGRRRHTPGQDPAEAPVVLPHVVVTVTETGTLNATVDGTPFAPPAEGRSWNRGQFGDLLDAITQNWAAPFRVEVRETDGTVFTDIIHAHRTPPNLSPAEPETRRGRRTKRPRREPIEVAADGFMPGEDIAVAVIVTHTYATGTGHAHVLIDPRHLTPATRASEVVLHGRVSGATRTAAAVTAPRQRQTGSMGDELTNAALIGLVNLVGLALLLRVAGSVAAFLTGTPQPEAGPAAGLGVLFNPADPGAALEADGLLPVVYWIVAVLLLAGLAIAGGWVWVRLRRHSRKAEADPRRLVGTATGHEVAQAASAKAVLRRAGVLRPSLDDPSQADVGYLLGTSHRKQVWASVEDSILLIGPPRSGKGLHVVINAILDAPGAVVTTSTRPDNLTATLRARERVGPVAVFDPQQLADGVPAGLRWSPVRGCEDPLTTMIRATGLAAATGLSSGGVESGGFWEGKTRTALQALLHAAALDHRPPAELFRWTLDPSAAAEAVAVLANSPRAATGWADSLGAMIDSDPKTRDSIWQGVSLALSALADPRVLDAVTPRAGESFDPERFIQDHGTLYLLATGAGAGASAALVAAFVEDLIETARRLAARAPGARLDPPLLLALDEIGNLAPLPSLPTLMAEGGGTGITTMPVLQSLAQARDKWSENQAGAIWDASIVKIILGGASNSKDLQDLATLIGERDEYTDSITLGDHGTRSNQRSVRRVPILPPDRIRTLPFGTGVTLLRSAPPIVTDLRAWPSRPDADQLKEDQAGIEALLRRPGS